MKKRFLYALSLAFCSAFFMTTSSCYYDNEEDLYSTIKTPTCDTANVKFSTFVSPLIASKCGISGCHASASPTGINLGNYTAIKNYLNTSKAVLIGSIKHDNRFSPMPKGTSKLPDCDVSKIERWITNGALNN